VGRREFRLRRLLSRTSNSEQGTPNVQRTFGSFFLAASDASSFSLRLHPIGFQRIGTKDDFMIMATP
jgi:hypothetical protein